MSLGTRLVSSVVGASSLGGCFSKVTYAVKNGPGDGLGIDSRPPNRHSQLAIRQAFRDNPELQQFVITEARRTGRRLGVGSYGCVEELQVKGLVCAGKRMHETLLEPGNEGVANIERKYLEECQVMPTGIESRERVSVCVCVCVCSPCVCSSAY